MTLTRGTISSISLAAGTCIRSINIGTRSINVTDVHVFITFIDIYSEIKLFKKVNYLKLHLFASIKKV